MMKHFVSLIVSLIVIFNIIFKATMANYYLHLETLLHQNIGTYRIKTMPIK